MQPTKAYAANNVRCKTPDFGDQSGADDGAGIGIGAVAAGAVLGAEVTGHVAHHVKKDSTWPGAASIVQVTPLRITRILRCDVDAMPMTFFIA